MSPESIETLTIVAALVGTRITELFAAAVGSAVAVLLYWIGARWEALLVGLASLLSMVGLMGVAFCVAIPVAYESHNGLIIAAYVVGPLCHLPAQAMLLWAALGRRPFERARFGDIEPT